MNILEISVTAGRTFNHPYEAYSNFRPSVTIKASVDWATEDHRWVLQELHEIAEADIERVKNETLLICEQVHEKEEEKRRKEDEEAGIPF